MQAYFYERAQFDDTLSFDEGETNCSQGGAILD